TALRRAVHGAEYSHVRATATQVWFQLRTDLCVARVRVLQQERMRAHHHAGDAVAALRSLLIHESTLQRTWVVNGPEAFESRDLFSRELRDWSDAGESRHSVDDHRAGPALSDPAPELGGVKLQVLAQNVQQRCVRVSVHTVQLAVYFELHADSVANSSPPGETGSSAAQRLREHLLEGAHGQPVAVSFTRYASEGLAPCGPRAGVPGFLRPAQGGLQIVFRRLDNSLGQADLSQQAGGEALAKKLTLQRHDGQPPVHRLPGCRVAGEGGAVQVDVHVIQEPHEPFSRQPGHDLHGSGVETCGLKGPCESFPQTVRGPAELVRRSEPELGGSRA